MRKISIVTASMMALIMLMTGCASTVPGSAAQAPEETNVSAQESGDEPEADTEAEEPAEAPENEEETGADDENEWDGGPEFESIADEFYGIFEDQTIEEAANKYAITYVDGGRYADYEGDIGDVIPEYKDKDLDGDRKSDVIRREGSHYVIEFSRGDVLTTGDFSTSPNEGEIIEFQDTACRNTDEILIAHYTFGTGGPVVWDTSIYSNADGEWKAYPLIDADSVINSKELQDYIAKRTGQPYEPGCVRVAAADMTTLLIDYGHKDGPEQTYDYESAYLHKYFAPDHVNDTEDYSYSGGSDFVSMISSWPLEMTGEEVNITSDEQYKLNIFLSNFSEQKYGEFDDAGFGAAMAHFALDWTEINKPSDVKYENDRRMIDHSSVNIILQKYFDTNLEEGDFYNADQDNPYGGTIEYDGEKGWYTEPAADGEMYANNSFTVVRDAQKIGGDWRNFLRVDFVIYALDTDEYDEHGIGKQQYCLSADEAAAQEKSGKLCLRKEGTAILCDAGSDGYKLYYYKVFDE